MRAPPTQRCGSNPAPEAGARWRGDQLHWYRMISNEIMVTCKVVAEEEGREGHVQLEGLRPLWSFESLLLWLGLVCQSLLLLAQDTQHHVSICCWTSIRRGNILSLHHCVVFFFFSISASWSREKKPPLNGRETGTYPPPLACPIRRSALRRAGGAADAEQA